MLSPSPRTLRLRFVRMKHESMVLRHPAVEGLDFSKREAHLASKLLPPRRVALCNDALDQEMMSQRLSVGVSVDMRR